MTSAYLVITTFFLLLVSGFESSYARKFNFHVKELDRLALESAKHTNQENRVLQQQQQINRTTDEILFIGDSWGEFAEELFNFGLDYCPDGKVVEIVKGSVGGSTAAEWASFVPLCDDEEREMCNIPDLFAGSASELGKVWITVGGNDFLLPGCTMFPDLLTPLRTILNRLEAEMPGIKVLIFGYSPPSCIEDEAPLCTLAAFTDFKNDFESQMSILSSEYANLTVVSVYNALGGSDTTLSASQYYADCIHPNRAGFEVLFGIQEIKQFVCQDTAQTGPYTGAGALKYVSHGSLITALLMLSFQIY